MISFDRNDKRFNHRVAGACIHEGYILLTSADNEDYWILPGGRIEFLEDSRTALRREMSGELGSEIEIGSLLWVIENFFPLSGKRYHEVAFVYKISPTDPVLLERSWTRKITDGSVPIEFRWFPIEDLEAVNLRPAFLKEFLNKSPRSTKHIVVRESEAEG